jgi:tetratricopeptide (TPR) repeat protein
MAAPAAADRTTELLGRAAQLRLRGVAENNAGRPARALQLFRKALRLIGPDAQSPASAGQLLRARVLISMAMSESELNGLDRGLLALAEVQDYLRLHAHDELAVHLHCQLGYMKVRGGHFAAGLQDLNTAVSLLDSTQPAEACNILINRGMVHVYLGDLRRARVDYERATSLARAYGLPVEEKKARHNLGEVEFFAGNLAAALRLMDEAAALEAEVATAVILTDRAKVLIQAGLHRDADDALLRAGELFRRDRLFKDVGEVELARAECSLLDGEIEAARRLAASARTRFRRRSNDRWRRDAELVLLQADLAAGRPGARLTPPALRLAAEYRSEGLTTRARTAQLLAAEALLSADRVDEAREIATTIGPVRPQDPISVRLHTRLVRARLQLAAGARANGRREIRTGLSELARHQARFGSIDLQTAGAVHGRQLAELDLGLALADGRPAGVLAAVEQSRAMSNRLQPVVAPTDEAAADQLAELRRVAEVVRALESDPTATHLVAPQRRRVLELQQALRSRAWQSEGSGLTRRPAGLAEIVAALEPDGAAFVSFVEAHGRLSALVLGSGPPRLVPLVPTAQVRELLSRARADLDVLAIGRLPGSMAAAVSGSLASTLAGLDLLLLAPLGLADRRLVISPTAALSTLGWNLLPSLYQRPVVIAPSATSWLVASAPRAASPVRTAVFAGPDLAFADHESQAVHGLWSRSRAARLYAGAESDQQQLKAAFTSADVVHVAAHGRHQVENPLFSSIRLADGPVFAYELERSTNAAEHVVLSACDLGRSTIRPGDETLGWTSVLLHLGTRSVVSGVARVHDETASSVMIDYHRLLSTGTDSAAALALAIADANGPPAPFVCFGSAWAPADLVAGASLA